MTHRDLLLLILAVGLASYLLRATPLALLRRPLKDPRLVAFIERLPYAILAAMVVPDVFSSTGDPLSAAIGFAVANELRRGNAERRIIDTFGAEAAAVDHFMSE